MKRSSIFIFALSFFGVSIPFSAFSETLSKPNESDIESTCRTLLYQVVSERGNKEKIVVLNATYKMICSEASGASLDLIHEQFVSIGDRLADSGACLSASGFVSSGVSGGFSHREIERFQKFNESTGGGWNHMEIERYLESSPLISDLSVDDLQRLKFIDGSVYELEIIESTLELMNLQRFQELQPQIRELHDQMELLSPDSFKGDELNN